MPRVLHRVQARATATGPIRPHTPFITMLKFDPGLKPPFTAFAFKIVSRKMRFTPNLAAPSSYVTRM